MTSILRNNLCFRFGSACAAAVWLTAGALAFAQHGSPSIIMGEVRIGGAFFSGELTIDVEAITGGRLVTRAYIHPDGSFEIRDVPSGTYQVSVENSRGEVIWHDLVPVAPGVTPLIIELDRGVREHARTGTVSIAGFRQNPPPAAVHELRLAEKASGQHRLRESIEHLQRAVQLAPEMQDARNNLGAKYLQSGDYEASQRELEAAVELDPEASIPHANLALAMLALSRPGEAESEARLALRRDPLSGAANFAAGAALNQQGKSDEALRFLERASEQVPQALLVEARILLARSQTSEAVAKLRSYLSRPGVSQRVEVTGWLDALSARGTR